MLKALEEQGERTLYFLLVDSESGVLDTIVSRCVRHYVKSENFDVSLANNKQIADIDVRNASIASLFALISELSDEQPIPQNLIKQMTDKALAECLEEEDWEAKGKYTQLIVLLGESLKRLESNSSPRLLLENCVLKYKKSSP
ncbi:MAG: hypothetical protein QY318_00815 [Candidatus Dojkabacteria bacterium]|nr:MAG: hypothetical protein QY318_00815 [Candidatus Dojkabacteria bacterium]